MKKILIITAVILFVATNLYATDVTKTSGYPKLMNWGSVDVLWYEITDVDDGETLSTATNALWCIVTWQDNPDTQGEAGGNADLSSGTITFYPATDNKAASVFVGIGGAY